MLIFALAVMRKKEDSLQFIKIITHRCFSHLLSSQTTKAIPSDKHSLPDLGKQKLGLKSETWHLRR